MSMRSLFRCSTPTILTPPTRRCTTCGEYIYKGKKFNARKETVEGEDYYGIKIFRCVLAWLFESNVSLTTHLIAPTIDSTSNGTSSWTFQRLCKASHGPPYSASTLCSAEITFKTDPKNTDYLAEHGASRNFEPWRDEREVEEDRIAKLEEEENNPMKALENRTTDSKREMDILDALQDLRSRNARHEKLGSALASEGKLESIVLGTEEDEEDEEERRLRLEAEEDERLVREVFSKVPGVAAVPSAPEDDSPEESNTPNGSTSVLPPPTVTVKRKATAQPGLDDFMSVISTIPTTSKSAEPPVKRKKNDLASSLGIKIKKKAAPSVKSLV